MRAQPKSKGSIRCEVIRAEGLKPADKNGLSDPFVTITLGWDQANGSWRTRKSEVVRKSLNPVFDWSCSFGYESFDALRNEKMVVQVFDWDKLSFNDPLGDCTVELSSHLLRLAAGETIALSLELEDRQSKPGKIWMQLTWEPAVSGTIQLDLIRAQGLKPADKNGLSDPFVAATIGRVTHKSRVVPKTLSPWFDW